MDDQNIVQASAALAVAAVAHHRIDGGVPFVVVPKDYSVQKVEEYLPAPTRKRGNVAYRDSASFCRAVLEQHTETTRLYGNREKPSFTAVFNDHGAMPGWRDHTATYACPLSVEWATWSGKNKVQMNQEQFAQFIEDNAPDCVLPESATMIEISRTLEAKKKVNFASGIRLDNGQHALTYEEEISGTAGKGKLQIPETFSIGISVLEGGPRYAVYARLRYRIADGGKLTMWYDLDRPHKVLEDAVKEVWSSIEMTTAMSVFNGG